MKLEGNLDRPQPAFLDSAVKVPAGVASNANEFGLVLQINPDAASAT